LEILGIVKQLQRPGLITYYCKPIFEVTYEDVS
jgi:hypothetical protein